MTTLRSQRSDGWERLQRSLGGLLLPAMVAMLVPLAVPCSAQTLTLAAPHLPDGAVNSPYPPSAFVASGGVAPYTYSLVNSTPPPGLGIDSATGIFGGVPTTAGLRFSVTVSVADSANAHAQAGPFFINVNAALSIRVPVLQVGVVNQPYPIAQFGAVGGGSGYVWSVGSGALPPGLTLNAFGGITGVPTAPGTSTFRIRVTDLDGNSTTTGDLVIMVVAALQLFAPPLPAGAVNTAYPPRQFAASGGFTPYTFSLGSGSLPPGLALDPATGIIAGVPLTAGTFPFVMDVHDSSNAVAASGQLSITITSLVGNLVVNAPPLPNGKVGQAYPPAIFSASGGTPPYSWTVVQGTLPVGLSLNPQTGTLSGTPSSAGTSRFTVGVADSNKQTGSSPPLVLTIDGQQVVISISVPPLPAGTVGALYPPVQFTASGGTPPYTWSIGAGALPTGLTLNPITGVVSGTPTAAGTFAFVVVATDLETLTGTTSQVSAIIAPVTNPLTIAIPALPAGNLNSPYNATFTATGGTPPYTWQISKGALPAGLSLGPQTGIISGTPVASGFSTFTVTAADNAGHSAATPSLGITVNQFPALMIASPPLNTAILNVAITPLSFAASGGVPPYLYSVSGSLPPGIVLNAQTGMLSGTPTRAGTYQFTAGVLDSQNTFATTPSLTWIVGGAISIIAPALPPAIVNVPYTPAPFRPSGGIPPYSWSITGTLPAGLSFDPVRAVLTGTPTTAGTSSFTISLRDSSGLSVATAPLTLTVVRPLSISVPTLSPGTLNTLFPPVQFAGNGGVAPYTFQISQGALPPGLTLDPQTGLLSGTPTKVGTSTFTVQIMDSAGAAAQTGSLLITIGAAPPVITSTAFPNAAVGTLYAQKLQASSANPPLTWSVTAGALPNGLALDAAGNITGTPLAPGTFNFTVQVKDALGLTATAPFSILSALPPLPVVAFGGVASPADPAIQPPFTVTLATPYPVALSGQVKLSFTSSAVVPADDPAIQFITGGRTADFTIAPGQTNAVFAVPQMAFSTGTVAGTITLSAIFTAGGIEVTPSPAPMVMVVIQPAAPHISSVSLQGSGNNITIVVTGFATPRQVTGATFTLTVSGGSLQSSTVTIDLTAVFAQWYQSTASVTFGSGFSYTQPFTLTGSGTVTGATVTLTNAQGSSAPVASK